MNSLKCNSYLFTSLTAIILCNYTLQLIQCFLYIYCWISNKESLLLKSLLSLLEHMLTLIYCSESFLNVLMMLNVIFLRPGVRLPSGPVARGQPKSCWASQSYFVAGPVGQPYFFVQMLSAILYSYL